MIMSCCSFLLLTAVTVVTSCDVNKGNDSYEGYYRKSKGTATEDECCSTCISESSAPYFCTFAGEPP